MKAECHYCRKIFEIKNGYYNRAKMMGNNVYCSRKHSGLGRRKSIEEKKRVKAVYDKRISQTPERKAAQHRYFKKDYAANPEKYRAIRKAKYKKHLEYLRRPEYRAKKKIYDQKRCAKLHYGDFGEAAIALRQLGNIVDNRKAKSDQDNLNKSKKRRKYGKTYSKKPQERAMAINTSR